VTVGSGESCRCTPGGASGDCHLAGRR